MTHSKRMAEAQVEAEVPVAVSWTEAQVAQWVEGLGFPQYKECFQNNFINGRKLILVEMSTLPRLGITDYKHMKIIAKAVRELLRQPDPDYNHCISLPERDPLGMFMQRKSRTGAKVSTLKFSHFMKSNKLQFAQLYWK